MASPQLQTARQKLKQAQANNDPQQIFDACVELAKARQAEPDLYIPHPGMTVEDLVAQTQRAIADGKSVVCGTTQFEHIKHLFVNR